MPLGYEQRATHRESSESRAEHIRAERIRAERIRAHETRHLLSRLSLSAQQAEAIEHFSRALVDEIIRGPIAETVALSRRPSEPLATIKSDVLGNQSLVT